MQHPRWVKDALVWMHATVTEICMAEGRVTGLKAQSMAGHALKAEMARVTIARQAQSGFDGLRGVYRAIQRGARPALADIAAIVADLPWFLRAAWWRFVERRVLPPGGARFELHLVIEQKPDPHNCITLSPTEADVFGQPLARIHWQFSLIFPLRHDPGVKGIARFNNRRCQWAYIFSKPRIEPCTAQ